MKEYRDLFEDEVSEVLREAGRFSVVRSGLYEWRPARVLYEDGIVSSGNGYYRQYIRGRSGTAIVGRGFLVSFLAHKAFTVDNEDR